MGAKPNAKGNGQFTTSRNPFTSVAGPTGRHAELAQVSNIGAVLDAVIRAGCAVLLGETRDGGALVLTVLDGEARHRTYCHSEEELDIAFTALWDMYTKD